MTDLSATAQQGSLEALKLRKRLLEDAWLLSLFVLFLALGLPWYLRILEIDFAPIAWSLFAYGLIYVALGFVADRLVSRRSLLALLGVLQLAGVLFLGYIWHLTGSLQNPMLLLAFVLPLMAGSLVLMNWQSYLTAALTLGTVLAVALMDGPELRWYVSQTGSWASWLVAAIPQTPETRPQPFPGLNQPPTYLFVLLGVFSALLLTVALLTDSLRSFLLGLYSRLETATRALTMAEDLSSEVLRISPLPAALVYSDTFMVAQASESFLHQFFLKPDSLLNGNLFQLVQFAYPEVVEALVTGKGGEVPLAVYRVEGELRIAKVRVQPLHYAGHRFAFVSLQDISDLQYLQATLNSVDDALLVVGPEHRVLYFNSAARQLWGELQPGMEASVPLRKANLPEGWWELGIRTRQERRLAINGQRLAAHCIAAPILGERETLTVITTRRLGGEP